jgi:hypothetical protein
VDGQPAGGFVTGREPEMKLRVRVQAPRWISADRLEVYANGDKVLDRPIIHAKNAVTKADLTVTLPRPKHDAWLVAIASGPGVSQPYWPIPRPYQPTQAQWDPRVIGSANAIRVDGDGDGRYSSPRDYATRLVRDTGANAPRLAAALAPFDTATAVQAASLCREQKSPDPAALRRAVENAAPHVRHAFVAYQNILPR